MKDKKLEQYEVNRLINSAWGTALRRKFEERLLEIGITKNQAVENLEISIRTLDGILDGTLKQVDFLSLLKIGQFLELSYEDVTALYTQSITEKHKDDLEESNKRTFILNNFDLPVLKSIGVIDSIRDFDHIEKRINEIFDLDNITDFDTEDTGAAFSDGARLPKNLNSRKYFISEAKSIFKLINNPYPYNEDALSEYFQNIRWHSIDIESGLVKVIQSLYTLGITVIFRPRMPKLQARGATFAVNNKPCIVLTDYRGFYPTLWFALLHELFHVIFDWDDIQKKQYHISDEKIDVYNISPREKEANDFASEYMIPKSKTEDIVSNINDRLFIRELAMDNLFHPSIAYAYYAYNKTTDDDNYWVTFKDFFPPFKTLLKKLGSSFEHTSKVKDIANFYKTTIFNIE